ncbi:MAG: class I SAM-dependent methyltransferase [Pelosinus sp.]|nr:class I SAM-dependent methyltransferase [Pelosinus sp.]
MLNVVSHTNPEDKYYNFIKDWIIPIIPEGNNKIMDLGCAAGQMGRLLKELKKASIVIGVEMYAPAAELAKQYYDVVHVVDADFLNLDYKEYFDFVICGDILEHMRDPWSMVAKIYGWLKVGGSLIISIPNVRYFGLLKDLILKGKFEYEDSGILDKTHLRFFTRNSIVELVEGAHFKVVSQNMLISGKKKNALNFFSIGVFEEFLGSQIKIVAIK